MVYMQTFMFSLASAGQMSLQGWKEVSLTLVYLWITKRLE